MNMRMRLNSVLSAAFCSTFWPSIATTENLPATALIQPAGTAPSAYPSKVSVIGSGRTMRARASPLSSADRRLDDAGLIERIGARRQMRRR